MIGTTLKRRLSQARDEWVKWAGRWMHARRNPVRPTPDAPSADNFVLTGPALEEQIARCIELGQPVLLEGPRGCGKSYCARAGYKLAVKRGFIPDKAWVAVQGNREIPRDYLAEDEIAFRVVPEAQGLAQIPPDAEESSATDRVRLEVLPARKNAPLFRFARRRLETGKPITDAESSRVLCKMRDGSDCDRFVLFLDEINRFSDGVLDSLLGLMEERIAILAGEEFELPVTIVMTMNPPGYDASARKLSPPLAARIARTYRLSTPDVDTMSDLIVAGRLRRLRVERELQAAKRADVKPLAEPEARLVRKAALITLCLWGDVSIFDRPVEDANTKSAISFEYLTPETRAQLLEVMATDHEVADAMRALSGLCHYGPDGRAIADWIVSAAALAIEDSHLHKSDSARIKPSHLQHTAIKTLSHKLYDSFSAATRPDQTRAKERAVMLIVTRMLNSDAFDKIVERELDDLGAFAANIADRILTGPDPHAPTPEIIVRTVRSAFIISRVTSDAEFQRWSRAFADGDIPAWLAKHPSVYESAPSPTEKGGFFDARHDHLLRLLAQCPAVCNYATALMDVAIRIPDADRGAWAAVLTPRFADEGVRARLRRFQDRLAQERGADSVDCKALGAAQQQVKANPELDAAFEDYLNLLARSLAAGTCRMFMDAIPAPRPLAKNIADFVRDHLGPVRRPLVAELAERTAVRLVGAHAFTAILKESKIESRKVAIDVANALEAMYDASARRRSEPKLGDDDATRWPVEFKGAQPLLTALAQAVRATGTFESFDRADRIQRESIATSLSDPAPVRPAPGN